MSRDRLPLFIFIDAFGWEILQANPDFLADRLVDRRRLRTILGYSCSCDPSIISGKRPDEHGHWISFYYAPASCPYRWVRHLRFLPSVITDHHRVRHCLSRLIAKVHGFTGYFQIYNVPFRYLPLFDYIEKQRIWEPGGLVQGRSVFDLLAEHGRPYYVHEALKTDEHRLARLKERIVAEDIDFAYISLGKMDALMHAKGPHDPAVADLVAWYDGQIRDLLALAEAHYPEVPFYVFTDHGMHEIHRTFDLEAVVDGLGLAYNRDYVAFYDATMLRLWYFTDAARERIPAALSELDVGRILPADELHQLGVWFPDQRFGETVFLMHGGIQIVPSFMGRKPTAGIHGFHPDEADSYAQICANRPLPDTLESIEQIYDVMTTEMNLEQLT